MIIKNVTLYQRNDPLVSLRSLDTSLEYRNLNELDMDMNHLTPSSHENILKCIHRAFWMYRRGA